MKKTIKMMLKEDFEKTYQPQLKASDVMEKTEYFNIDVYCSIVWDNWFGLYTLGMG